MAGGEALFAHFWRDFSRAVGAQGGHVARVTDGAAIYHSFFGGPVLARGGSGDLLAGLIGGLLAQTPEEPLLAACRGVVWHGRAADGWPGHLARQRCRRRSCSTFCRP